MSKIVTGSSLQPLSGSSPKQIVLLHGYGSSGADLIALAPHWQRDLPDALFLAPNAPQRLSYLSSGYQWWPLPAFTPQALASGTTSAAQAKEAFIERKLHQYGLTEANLAIVGFSQGTIMALHVGLRRPRKVAAIVGYPGMLACGPELSHLLITRPRVLLVYGSADMIVPIAALNAVKTQLEHFGVDVTAHISPGVEKSVDPVGLRMGEEFVGKALTD